MTRMPDARAKAEATPITATGTDVAYIDGEAHPINKGETMLDLLRRTMGPSRCPRSATRPTWSPSAAAACAAWRWPLQADGPTRVMASCHTPVAKGQFITTHSERMKRLRKNIVELVLTNYDTEKLKTEDHGANELYNVVQQIGFDMDSVRYPKGAHPLDAAGPDAASPRTRAHPYMVSDLSSCINCYRCVRACDEVQGEFVLTMAGRGFNSWIAKGTGESFKDSDCVSCGACAQACPTSAITDVFKSKETKADECGAHHVHLLWRGLQPGGEGEGRQVAAITAPYDAEANQGHTCLKGRYAFRSTITPSGCAHR
jgi:formate dehydrogenase major subunit